MTQFRGFSTQFIVFVNNYIIVICRDSNQGPRAYKFCVLEAHGNLSSVQIGPDSYKPVSQEKQVYMWLDWSIKQGLGNVSIQKKYTSHFVQPPSKGLLMDTHTHVHVEDFVINSDLCACSAVSIMCVESSEWTKLGGMAFFCFLVSGG